jgi:hypothetical protein
VRNGKWRREGRFYTQGEKELEVVIASSSESDSTRSKKASRARVGSKMVSNFER